MLISDQHRFIFIHNPKCAGTSIHQALVSFSNYMCRHANTSISYYSRKIFGESKKLSNFSYHISASELKNILGDEFWERYYSFGVVRNPYDRLISNFKYINRSPAHDLHAVYDEFNDFSEFIHNIHSLPWKDYQHHYLAVNGQILVDKIMRFENLDEDFSLFIRKFHLPDVKLNRVNISQRRKDYSSYYNAEMISIVNEVYDEDFRIFGYEKIKP